MNNEERNIRQELKRTGDRIIADKLAVGPGGNISARIGNVVFIKPSGFAFDDISAEDYVAVDIKTKKVLSGDKKPSSELHMHIACYSARPDVSAVVHTHPPLATGIATAGKKILALTPDFVAYVEKIEYMKFIVPTGIELADATKIAVRKANSVLMTNHGLTVVGANLKEAYYKSIIIEETARTQLAALQSGKVRVLTQAEFNAVKGLDTEEYRRQLLRKK